MTVAVAACVAGPAWAQTKTFNVPAQDAGPGITVFSRQAGVQILAAESATRGRRTQAVVGAYTLDAGLERLLAGTGLRVASNNGRTVTLQAVPQDAAASGAADPAELEQLVVTGTRIRGAPPTSPVITITQQDIRRSGYTDLGEVMRSLPQNANSGQNPGIQFGAEAGGANLNLNGESNVNLRGVGQAATLTLLDGRRLPYGGASQGVDVSAIPTAAVGRIEIIADGGSALYGSDAVGAVANIILRRDFTGVETTALYGGATDGGGEQRLFNVTAGTTWDTGGVMLVAGVNRTTDITAPQRTYTRAVSPDTTLYPASSTRNLLAALRQELPAGASLSIDALYNFRRSSSQAPTGPGSLTASGRRSDSKTAAYLLSPIVEVQLPGRWRGSVSATLGEDVTKNVATFFSKGVGSASLLNYYDKTVVSEANLEGPLFSVPAGDVRVAIGGGYRKVDLQRVTSTPGGTWSDHSTYAYGELFAPLVSPGSHVTGVERLSLTAAVRYEQYGQSGDVATPKLGFSYAPGPDLSFSGSWGKSFRAPSLFDQFQGTFSALAPASLFGGVGLPANATAILMQLGNTNLKPEKSDNWTLTAGFHPASLPGLRVELSYFNIDYRNRITSPLASGLQVLNNPLLAQFVTRAPSLAQINAVVAQSNNGFSNATGAPFDPATVVAIIDYRLTNIARERADGWDMNARYQADLAGGQSLTAGLNVTYLRLTDQLTAQSGEVQLAGQLFRPPQWKGRASLTWTDGAMVLSSFANYTGSARDIRTGTTTPHISDSVTFDATGSYRFALRGRAQGAALQLSALNLLNKKPQRIYTTAPYYVAYDSVNASPIGRRLASR